MGIVRGAWKEVGVGCFLLVPTSLGCGSISTPGALWIERISFVQLHLAKGCRTTAGNSLTSLTLEN